MGSTGCRDEISEIRATILLLFIPKYIGLVITVIPIIIKTKL